ncbi:melanoma-associated antigen B2 [Tupaia chinensis]|uniref:Melanoma-associated antigen B4 n=1 Tax=Tupaia chinensis TaxID=246437 RepID=L9JCK5_TUPCH|nr:melanoma-associated antigen B2 [Tupaia chinensis]ELW48311.1 Melanoma-associated antigen B4 [Tupaia chinensis]
MPRGQKSKLRAREKRRQAREETQDLESTQAPAAEEKESLCCSSSVLGDAAPRSPAAGSPQEPKSAPPITTAAAAGDSHKKSNKGAKRQSKKNIRSSEAPSAIENLEKDPLNRKAVMLVQFLLYKYKMQEPIRKGDMQKVVNRRYKEDFPEILKRASERIELIFGLELKETDPRGQSYAFVIKPDLTDDGDVSSGLAFPRKGLLMPLLGVIFLNGNQATEEEIWEFLNILGVYDGEKHFIFGEPRKLITEDLVQEQYLEYCEVPNSHPPRYQFLWGPRAHAETSKMRVLEFLAKVNDTIPRAFPSSYEEALRDEEERAQARGAATPSTTIIKARPSPRAKPNHSATTATSSED